MLVVGQFLEDSQEKMVKLHTLEIHTQLVVLMDRVILVGLLVIIMMGQFKIAILPEKLMEQTLSADLLALMHILVTMIPCLE